MNCKYRLPHSDGKGCKKYISARQPETCGFCNIPNYFRCTECLQVKLPALSVSSVNDFITCREKYHLSHILGLTLKDEYKSVALKMGSIFDAWMEARHSNRKFAWVQFSHYSMDEWSFAKMMGVMEAIEVLNVKVDKDCNCQYEINVPLSSARITGFMDRKYDDYFVETKFSSRPDNYLEIPTIQFQVGTYFMDDEDMEYVVMEVVRAPGLKPIDNKNKTETPDEYRARVRQDVVGRPSFYLPGWSAKNHTFGKKYYRSEFNLDRIREIYEAVARDMRRAIDEDNWYPNERACLQPWRCDFYDIRKTGGVVSENLYEIKQRKGGGKK